MKLSILIPTLTSRRNYLNALMSKLCMQHSAFLSQTEILMNCDSKVKSIGKKRNELLQSATGEYVVFVDDDDEVSGDYLQEIFAGIEKGVDHIGIQMLYIENSYGGKLVKCSKDYAWHEKEGVYYRGAQHVCPIKSEIAKQVTFPDISFGEDKTYSDLVSKLIKTEHLVEKPIYYYRYRSVKND